MDMFEFNQSVLMGKDQHEGLKVDLRDRDNDAEDRTRKGEKGSITSDLPLSRKATKMTRKTSGGGGFGKK